MDVSITVELDDAVHTELEALARARGVDLAIYVGDLATQAARQARRARIRADSAAVAAYVAATEEGKDLYDLG